MNAFKNLKISKILPFVIIENADHAVPTAEAIMAGGVNVIEIGLRTDAGIEAIKKVKQADTGICVGAGTVITMEQCKKSADAGAEFIVTPGFDKQIVKWCLDYGMPILPGCVTPTEIMEALQYGIDVIKFFPANVYGGLTGMKALSGPFPMISFVPTGGVSLENVAEYVSKPYIWAVGGSWLCAKSDIEQRNFTKITDIVRESLALCQ